MKKTIAITSLATILMLFMFSINSFANKTSIKIIAPEKAEAGTEITIKIEVSHMGNSSGHHTDWVWVKINGEEYKRWEYTKKDLPENQSFTLEFTIKAEKDLEVIAEGNCNKHGSKGEEKINIKVEQ